jgi:predicted molibdopterin-dependent oxidoreductase YjgC
MGRFEPLYENRRRITEPLVRANDGFDEVSWDEAVKNLAGRIKGAKAGEVGLLLSSQSSNEALYVMKKLFKEGLKLSNIGLLSAAAPKVFTKAPGKLEDIAKSDIILLVGADPVNDQPVVSFAVKRAVDRGAKLIVVDDNKENGLAPFAFMAVNMAGIGKAAEVAARADSPFVLFGAGVTPAAAGELKKLEGKVGYVKVESGVNTAAAAAIGLSNGYNPSAVKLLYVALGEQEISDAELSKKIPKGAFVAVQASYASPLTERADLVLPAAIWSEQSGTLTNTEGRIQDVNKAVEPVGAAKADWEALQMLSAALGTKIAVSKAAVSAEVVQSLK